MAIDYEKLKSRPFPPIEHSYSARDSILYALGLGLGADPMDPDQLRFTFEEAEGYAALPSMAVVLATPGFWAREPDTGLDWRRILHGEQGLEIHAPVPAEGTVVGHVRIEEIIDKGEGKGALLYIARDIVEKSTGKLIATSRSTTFARGDGGFGGPSGPVRPVHAIPDRAPDLEVDYPTLPQAALIYRLSGDPNPLHASPEVAAQAGFPRPILHGLCSYGIAGYAILKEVCGGDPARLKRLDLRFTRPVFPGETLRIQIWKDGETVSFRALVPAREVTALDNGLAVVAAS